MSTANRLAVGSGNCLHPDRMIGAERLAELADILGAGVVRLKARKSSQLAAGKGESSLDFTANQSGHEPGNDIAGDRR